MNTALKRVIAEVLATPNPPKPTATTTREKALAKYTHGHHNRYFIGGCRCDLCGESATAYSRAKRHERYNTPHDQIPHGTKNGYSNYGCRCKDCTQAIVAYVKGYSLAKR